MTVTPGGRDVPGDVTGTVTALTGAERTRRWRERKKAQEGQERSSGVQADGSWAPAFPGQRAPFTPGHTLSLTHGANSPRIVGPLAAKIRAELLGDPDCPAYLRDRGWRFTIESWSEARAELVLLRDWRDKLTAEEAATEHTFSEDDEMRPSQGRMSRRSHAQRVESVLAAIDRVERRAERLGAKLGLDPLSRSKLGKNITSQQFDLARMYAQWDEDARKASGQ